MTPAQWIQLDDIAGTYANHTLRLTTRATFQYHGVIKSNLKRTMQAIDAPRLAADERVRIPLRGRVESLNVSVATGVCLFEAVRQRARG